MQLTDKQLKIMERADKTLSFGCIVQPSFTTRRVKIAKILAHFWGGDYRVIERIDTSKNAEEYENDFWHCEFHDYENWSFYIIWHAMNRWRLCYLRWINNTNVRSNSDERKFMMMSMATPEYLQQTVLDRPEELQDKVIAFLESLPQDDNL